MKTRLGQGMITLGEPIPWALSNDRGKVVFATGFVVNTQASLDRMLGMDLFLDQGPPDDTMAQDETPESNDNAPVSPSRQAPGPPALPAAFESIGALADQLQVCCSEVLQRSQPALTEMETMVTHARQMFLLQKNACVAAVHVYHDRPHSSLHPIYSIFLVELLAARLGYGESTHKSVCCAALTANLGMFEFQDLWHNQAGPLDPDQKQQLRSHPDNSVGRLQVLGVKDPLWLKIVQQHHERADGSGYPRGLQGNDLQAEALVLGMIDRYLSQVMPRRHRRTEHPTAALRHIHEDSNAYGKGNVDALIRQVGVYPPGTSVRLVNGEIAVVLTHRPEKAAHPEVVSVGRDADDFFDQPIPRDTTKPEFKLKGLYHPNTDEEINPARMVGSW